MIIAKPEQEVIDVLRAQGYDVEVHKPLVEPLAMLTHAHQDAQRTGHCHWCHMTMRIDKHVIVSYIHADDCELSSLVSREEE